MNRLRLLIDGNGATLRAEEKEDNNMKTLDIRKLERREDLTLLQNDGDILELQSETGTNFDGYFIKTIDGEYTEIYGFYGQVPVLTKLAYRVLS
jgi:hypothetical protein